MTTRNWLMMAGLLLLLGSVMFFVLPLTLLTIVVLVARAWRAVPKSQT